MIYSLKRQKTHILKLYSQILGRTSGSVRNFFLFVECSKQNRSQRKRLNKSMNRKSFTDRPRKDLRHSDEEDRNFFQNIQTEYSSSKTNFFSKT